MNLAFFTGLAGAAVVAVLFAAGAFLPWLPSTFFGPGGSPTPSPAPTVVAPSPDASAAPSASPVAPTLLAGDVPFEGTDWLLVGRSDSMWGGQTGGPAFIGASGNAWLRIADGAFTGSSGCYAISGAWPAQPDGDRTTPLSLVARSEDHGQSVGFSCSSAQDMDDSKLSTLLQRVGAFQVTRGGYDLLASGLGDGDLDPDLLAHYQANPDLERLILRDQSGEGILIYAPVTPESVSPPAQVGLVGPLWTLAGWQDGTDGPVAADRTTATTIQFGFDGTFDGSTACGPIGGRWAHEDSGLVHGPWVVEEAPLLDACSDPAGLGVLANLPGVDVGSIVVTGDARRALRGPWWDGLRESLGPDPRTVLILADADEEPLLVYALATEDDPGVDASPAASASPIASPTFVTGDVPFVGTTWQLVGRIDGARGEGDPAYISPVGDRPATLRFERGGRFGAHTGCHAIGGSWDAEPKSGRTFPADLQLEGAIRANACPDELGSQDLGTREDLDGAGALQLTREPYQTLASDLTDADLDPTLLAHFEANPDLLRLIVRDQSGEGSLIYAPVVPDVSGLTGRTWGIAGYRTDAGLVDAGDADAVTVRFDDDGTFTAADGCGTLGGVWGEPLVADGPPIAGETDVDAQNQWCLDDRSQDVLRVLQDLELRNGFARTSDLRSVLDGESVPDGLVSRVAERGEGLVLRDPDDLVALVLVPSERLPSPPPSAAPSPAPLAFVEGESVPDDTTWVVMGYLDKPTGPDAPLVYRAVGDGLRPWIRFDGVTGGWSTGDTGCDRFVARRNDDGGPGRLIDILDLSPRDCDIAQTRVATRVADLFEQASMIDRASQVLEPAEVAPRRMQFEAGLQAHFEATPGIQRMGLRDSDGVPLLVLAPIEGGLPGVPGSDAAIDPAPQTSALVRIAADRAGVSDGPWQVIGRRDDSGRLRLASSTQPAIVALGSGGAISGSTGCDAVTGSWLTTGGPDETGWQPSQVTMERGNASTDTCTAVQADERATMLELPIGGLRVAADTVEAMRVQPDFATMDPWLWAWLAATPNLPMLTLTDAAGVPQLLLAPIQG